MYNGYKRGVYNAYLQKLSPDAQPILVGTERLDPHWFVSPTDGSWHIVSCWLENGRFVQDSYTSEKLDGSLGATMIRKTSLPASADFVGIEEVLVRAAFKGGVSPDGKFAATGYGYAFLAKLE